MLKVLCLEAEVPLPMTSSRPSHAEFLDVGNSTVGADVGVSSSGSMTGDFFIKKEVNPNLLLRLDGVWGAVGDWNDCSGPSDLLERANSSYPFPGYIGRSGR